MRKKNLQDERIIAERCKIQSDSFSILFIILLMSAVVQHFILEATFEQYMVEFICVIGMGLYIIIRNIMIGNDIFSDGKGKKALLLMNSLVTGTIVTIINGISNYIRNVEHYASKPTPPQSDGALVCPAHSKILN